MADFLNDISEKYLENKIDQHTPDEYYLAAANQMPELRNLIIEKAKAVLSRGLAPKKQGRRPKVINQIMEKQEGGNDASHNA